MVPDKEPDTLTFDLLRQIDRDVRRAFYMPPRLLASPAAYESLTEHFARMEAATPHIAEAFAGPMRAFNSFLGIQITRMHHGLFQPPEKPLRSRPHRTYVRTKRQRVQAERKRIRGQTLVSWRGWKGRKVPSRTGYPRTSVFMYDPRAVFLDPGA